MLFWSYLHEVIGQDELHGTVRCPRLWQDQDVKFRNKWGYNMIKPHSGIGHNRKCKSAGSKLTPKKDDFSPDSEAIGVLTSSKGYVGYMCVLKRACWCRCRVPQQGACQGAAVRVVRALWSWLNCADGSADSGKCDVCVKASLCRKLFCVESARCKGFRV